MTQAFDPYSVLGVKRDADEEEIRTAYRQASKRTHPDTGGDPEQFREVKRAYDILSDPERRKRFDQSGATDEPKIDDPRGRAMNIVGQALQNVLRASNGAAGADHFPMHDMISVWMEENLHKTDEMIDKITGARDNLRKLLAKTRRKDEKPSEIAAMLRSTLDNQEAQLQELAKRREDLANAAEIVAAHDFGDMSSIETIFLNEVNFTSSFGGFAR